MNVCLAATQKCSQPIVVLFGCRYMPVLICRA